MWSTIVAFYFVVHFFFMGVFFGGFWVWCFFFDWSIKLPDFQYYIVFKLIKVARWLLTAKFPICSVVSKVGISTTSVVSKIYGPKKTGSFWAHPHSECSSSCSPTSAVCPGVIVGKTWDHSVNLKTSVFSLFPQQVCHLWASSSPNFQRDWNI